MHFTARFQTYSRALPVSTVQWRAETPDFHQDTSPSFRPSLPYPNIFNQTASVLIHHGFVCTGDS